MDNIQYGFKTPNNYLWEDLYDTIEECQKAVEEYYKDYPEDMHGGRIVEIHPVKRCEIPRKAIWHDC